MLRTLQSITEPLRGQPLALALVIINLLFLIGFAFMLREISHAVERKDAVLTALVQHCVVPGPRQSS